MIVLVTLCINSTSVMKIFKHLINCLFRPCWCILRYVILICPSNSLVFLSLSPGAKFTASWSTPLLSFSVYNFMKSLMTLYRDTLGSVSEVTGTVVFFFPKSKHRDIPQYTNQPNKTMPREERFHRWGTSQTRGNPFHQSLELGQ